MLALILSGLFIFILRMVDITLYTMRMLMVMRGRKLAAWVAGFFQALVFVVVIRAILTNLDNPLILIGYSTGFATGLVVGMWIEDRLAIGYVLLRIISSHQGLAIAEQVRAEGYAITEIPARGKDGMVSVLHCSVKRKQRDKVTQLVETCDPQAFITVENVRSVGHGYWGG